VGNFGLQNLVTHAHHFDGSNFVMNHFMNHAIVDHLGILEDFCQLVNRSIGELGPLHDFVPLLVRLQFHDVIDDVDQLLPVQWNQNRLPYGLHIDHAIVHSLIPSYLLRPYLWLTRSSFVRNLSLVGTSSS